MFNETDQFDSTFFNDVILFGKFLGMVEAFGYKSKEELPEDQRNMVQNVVDQMSPEFQEFMGVLIFQVELERMLDSLLDVDPFESLLLQAILNDK